MGLIQRASNMEIKSNGSLASFFWEGAPDDVFFDQTGIKDSLLNFDLPLIAIQEQGEIGLSNNGNFSPSDTVAGNVVAWLPPISSDQLGDPGFCET